MVRSKQKAFKQAKSSYLTRNWEKFKEIATESRKVCCNACMDFTATVYQLIIVVMQILKGSIHILKAKRQIMQESVHSLYINSKEKARILNLQFCNVFPNNKCDVSLIPTESTPNSLEGISIEINGVIKLLNELNWHKASGLDKIHATYLQEN